MQQSLKFSINVSFPLKHQIKRHRTIFKIEASLKTENRENPNRKRTTGMALMSQKVSFLGIISFFHIKDRFLRHRNYFYQFGHQLVG